MILHMNNKTVSIDRVIISFLDACPCRVVIVRKRAMKRALRLMKSESAMRLDAMNIPGGSIPITARNILPLGMTAMDRQNRSM